MRLIPFLWCLLVGFVALAQEMSLQECTQYALTNNLTLTNTRINTKIAQEEYQQARRSSVLPTVDAGLSGGQLFGKSIDPNTNNYVDEGTIFSGDVSVAAQLKLFEGFRQQNTIRYNKLRYLMSEEEVNQREVEIAFEVMNRYYDALYYTEMLAIADTQLVLTTLNMKRVQQLVEMGLKAESDLLEMEAQQAAEIHRRTTVKNKRENALLLLKKVMNFPVDQPLMLEKEEFSALTYEAVGVDSICSVAYRVMPSIRRSELKVDAGRRQLAIRKSRWYPSLSLGGVLYSGYADSWMRPINEADPSIGYETVPLGEQLSRNVSKSISLRLRIPLFSAWANCSAVKNAKYSLAIARNELEISKRTLRQEIAEDYQQMEALAEEQEQLHVKQQAMQEAYRVAEKKMGQGLMNVIDLYVAKNQLANAEAELLRTRFQWTIKKKTMDLYLGKWK